MKLEALRSHTYNGEELNPGDKYEALDDMHGQLLVAFGHARLSDETPEKQAPKKRGKGRPRKKSQGKTE